MLFVAFIQDENNPLLCTFSFASLWAVFSLGTCRGNLKHDLDDFSCRTEIPVLLVTVHMTVMYIYRLSLDFEKAQNFLATT